MALPNQFTPKDTPFEKLDCEAAFKGLTAQEKRYAHYLSRASWDGQLITFFQTSPEAPLIFIFLDKILRLKPTIEEVKALLREKHSFTDDDVTALLVYAGAFFGNGGNYRGFGDTKFVPEVPQEKLKSLLEPLFGAEADFYLEHCLKPMMDYESAVRILGFPPHGITTYWSANCDEGDVKVVAEFLKEKGIDAYNQRVFKTVSEGKTTYEIRFPSAQPSSEADTTREKLINKDEIKNGVEFKIRRGDYSSLLPNVVKSLEEAQQHAANDNEKQMLKEYIDCFTTGSLQAHKEGSRFWIKDKGPAVESYIGFIETYRDPAGSRAEFESFVAVVNKEGSKKLGVLTEKAEQIIKDSMPWPKEYEKDSYLKPDFTALDIITFAGSGVPAGINIPNYDEIRQSEGFKNVHLQNVITANMSSKKVLFVTDSDSDLIKKHRELSFEVQVGLHELLGHGSGKLFRKEAEEKFNFDVTTLNPLTGKPVATFYTEGQTYDSVFGSISSSYEECRAEAIGMFLCLDGEVLKIFGVNEPEQQEDVLYVNWFTMVLGGVQALVQYDEGSKKWTQAHSQARYVILRVLLEYAPGLVTVEEIVNEEDKQPDLKITVDRKLVKESGKKAMQDFLLKLQVYKSTADIAEATQMYSKYSEVGSEFSRWRKIAIDRKRPRVVLVQGNTRLVPQNELAADDVELLMYASTPEGCAQSWVDRYTDPEPLYKAIKELYTKDEAHFPLRKN